MRYGALFGPISPRVSSESARYLVGVKGADTANTKAKRDLGPALDPISERSTLTFSPQFRSGNQQTKSKGQRAATGRGRYRGVGCLIERTDVNA